MCAPKATPHAIASLRNWIAGTGAIARVETEFLAKERDLMVLSCEPDELLSSLETLLVRLSTWLCTSLRNVSTISWSSSIL